MNERKGKRSASLCHQKREGPEFNQHVYDRLLPRFRKALATITETDPQEKATAFVRRVRGSSSIDTVFQLEPYIVKFFEDVGLPEAFADEFGDVFLPSKDKTPARKSNLDTDALDNAILSGIRETNREFQSLKDSMPNRKPRPRQ